jgi:hypothetical protein
LFEEVFDQVFKSAKDFIVEIDLSNQPYSFSYHRFVTLNPACKGRENRPITPPRLPVNSRDLSGHLT